MRAVGDSRPSAGRLGGTRGLQLEVAAGRACEQV